MNRRQGTLIIMKVPLQVCSLLPEASAICPLLGTEKEVPVKHSRAQGGEGECQQTPCVEGRVAGCLKGGQLDQVV